MEQSSIRLSTVTPVYAGQDYIEELVAALAMLRRQLQEAGGSLALQEAIFVLDAPVDGSADVLERLSQEHEWVHSITLSRNFGQHAATIAGILHSSGDWVVTLDEDMQHDPMQIPVLLKNAVEQGSDVIYARPEERVHGGWYRDLSSRGVKWLVSLLSGNQNVRKFNSFRLIRGSVARAAASVCSHQTYLDMALCWYSSRIAMLRLPLVDRRSQEQSTSGYGFRRLLSHARRLIISSDAKVFRVSGVIGGLAVILAVVYGLWVLISTLLFGHDPAIRGWPSIMLTVLFLSGITIAILSVLVELINVLVLHTQGKPTFFSVDRSGDSLVREALIALEHAASDAPRS